jgi:hypothetical protein
MSRAFPAEAQFRPSDGITSRQVTQSQCKFHTRLFSLHLTRFAKADPTSWAIRTDTDKHCAWHTPLTLPCRSEVTFPGLKSCGIGASSERKIRKSSTLGQAHEEMKYDWSFSQNDRPKTPRPWPDFSPLSNFPGQTGKGWGEEACNGSYTA